MLQSANANCTLTEIRQSRVNLLGFDIENCYVDNYKFNKK